MKLLDVLSRKHQTERYMLELDHKLGKWAAYVSDGEQWLFVDEVRFHDDPKDALATIEAKLSKR